MPHPSSRSSWLSGSHDSRPRSRPPAPALSCSAWVPAQSILVWSFAASSQLTHAPGTMRPSRRRTGTWPLSPSSNSISVSPGSRRLLREAVPGALGLTPSGMPRAPLQCAASACNGRRARSLPLVSGPCPHTPTSRLYERPVSATRYIAQGGLDLRSAGELPWRAATQWLGRYNSARHLVEGRLDARLTTGGSSKDLGRNMGEPGKWGPDSCWLPSRPLTVSWRMRTSGCTRRRLGPAARRQPADFMMPEHEP